MLAFDRPATRLALVNNMPDAAFEATERQFLDLIRSAPTDTPLEVALYSLPGIERGSATRASLRERYLGLDELRDDPPDALIVTGTEPHAADLESEPYWDALVELITWAERATVSTVLSCLAAHAALLIFDGIERQRLPHKCSGIVDNAVAHPHPLVTGLGDRVLVPHSRLNDVPTALLDARGYTTLLRARDASWTVAVKRRSRCLFVFCQGHLEYDTDTLLREYRRDVRRFLAGERSTYPRVPVDYLDPDDVSRLEVFRAGVGDRTEPHVEDRFPYGQIASHLVNPWRQPAERFYANWLRHVAQQAHHTRERVWS